MRNLNSRKLFCPQIAREIIRSLEIH
uniref:Uncharacterized protein n=1 Tax=Anguilla anguilla TaxID=7936 RepID=A0A0E9RS13_ANGAN